MDIELLAVFVCAIILFEFSVFLYIIALNLIRIYSILQKVIKLLKEKE
jgi:hypothetical protein